MERRSALQLLGKALSGLCAGAGVLLAARFVRPQRIRDLSRLRDLGPVGALPLGAIRHLLAADIHLFHAEDGFYALSGRCTHLGCSLQRNADGFACPCHGARFDLQGRPLSGPATRQLRWHRLTVSPQGHILLHLDATVPPGRTVRA